MNYRAFLSAIIVLALIGTILVLLQERSTLQEKVTDLSGVQNTLPDPVDQTIPTQFVEYNTDSFYPREKLVRESARCDYGNCLFSGEGGLIGLTVLDAFYTTTVRKDMDNRDTACHALYVKRGPSGLAKDSKFSRFFGAKTDVLVIPFEENDVLHLADLEQIKESTPNTPLEVSVFLPDSLEMGTSPCYGGMRILDVRAL